MIKVYGKSNGCANCAIAKETLERHNIEYKFIDVMEDKGALDFIKSMGYRQVPIIDTEIKSISTEVLDNLYEVYCNEEQRQVEGFIILDKSSNTIRKYVRYNREGKLVPYKETGGK